MLLPQYLAGAVAVGRGHRRRQVASRGHHYRGPFAEVGRRARPRRGWSRRHQVASASVDAAATPRLGSSRAGDGRAAGEVQGAAGEVQGRPAAGAALGRSRAWEGVLACCGSGFVTPIREESSRGGCRLSGDSGGRG
jgi:hypothetical protein